MASTTWSKFDAPTAADTLVRVAARPAREAPVSPDVLLPGLPTRCAICGSRDGRYPSGASCYMREMRTRPGVLGLAQRDALEWQQRVQGRAVLGSQ
jgi:hypothetical protein